MRYALLALALASPFFLPWPLTIVLAIIAAIPFPLAPLAVGIILDSLYYAHGAFAFPLFSILGLLATLVAIFVQQFIKAGRMRG